MKEKVKYISIIIPVRNEEQRIEGTLNSIISSNFPLDQIEVLIVDGNSEDSTLKIIKSYENKILIKIIHNKLKFVSSSFNLALNKSRGEIIFRIDGHCEIEPDFLSRCIKLLNKKNIDIAGGCIETVSHGLIGNVIAVAQSSFFGVGGVRFRNSKSNKGSYVNTLAFGAHKREIFSEIGGYDEDMICNQDDDFNFRAIQAGKKIWLDPQIKTKYFSRTSYIKLFKQYFYYGYYKVRGIQKRRQIISIRHIVPSIYIISLIITIIGGHIFSNIWLSYSILVIYLFTNICASLFASKRIFDFPMLFISFWILHISYGLGFIWGLIKFMFYWKNNKLKDTNFNKDIFVANSMIIKDK